MILTKCEALQNASKGLKIPKIKPADKISTGASSVNRP